MSTVTSDPAVSAPAPTAGQDATFVVDYPTVGDFTVTVTEGDLDSEFGQTFKEQLDEVLCAYVCELGLSGNAWRGNLLVIGRDHVSFNDRQRFIYDLFLRLEKHGITMLVTITTPKEDPVAAAAS